MEYFIEYMTNQWAQLQTNKHLPIGVNNAGHYSIETQDYDTNRPEGREDYQIIYVLSGKMRVSLKGKEQIVDSGNVVLFKPNEPQVYAYLCDVPCEVYWVHFFGSFIPDLIEDLHLNQTSVIKVGESPKIVDLMNTILINLITKNFMSATVCVGNLMLLLSELANINSVERTENNENRFRFGDVLLQMHNITVKFSLKEFAQLCNMSVSRFSHSFKEQVGMSPYAYYLDIRINHAKVLLLESNLSIGEISNRLCFNDQFYFSRLFKKNVGISPQEFRKNNLPSKNSFSDS